MNSVLSLILVSVFIFFSAPWSHAEQPAPSRDQATQTGPDSSSPPALTYVPPRRGAPAAGLRVGGGTRSIDKNGPVVSLLAPDHVGLTSHDQPALYWFVSDTVSTPIEVEITLIEADGVKPIMKAKFQPPIEPGIQRVNLADHGVHLAAGGRYEWSVALVLDPKRRSRDIVVSGGIERVDNGQVDAVPSDETPNLDIVSRSAKAGFWYDTIMGMSDLIAASPTDQSLRRQRADLLETVGLKEVSLYDRGK